MEQEDSVTGQYLKREPPKPKKETGQVPALSPCAGRGCTITGH